MTWIKKYLNQFWLTINLKYRDMRFCHAIFDSKNLGIMYLLGFDVPENRIFFTNAFNLSQN